MIRKNITPTTLMLATLLLSTACQTDDETPAAHDGQHVYTMQLQASISHYDPTVTRAAEAWTDGATIILQFDNGTQRVAGTATYSATKELWTVTTDRALAADDRCEAYYFEKPQNTSGRNVTFSTATVCYADTQGSYVVDEETNSILVTAELAPATARLRFAGKAGTTFGVGGLQQLQAYNGTTNTFSTSEAKLSGTIGADGHSAYYYVCFAKPDERRLTVDATEAAVYARSFADNVLLPGTSGRITLPTAEQMGQWQMVNAANGQEITLPVVSAPQAVTVYSHRARLTATIESTGNGTIVDAGFLYATNAAMTGAQQQKCTPGTQLSAELRALESATTYYVQAFVTNERGTTTGTQTTFTTNEEAGPTSFGKEGFGGEQDWK